MMIAAAASSQPRMLSPEDQAQQLKERLTLSDEQTQEVTTILKEQREKMMTLRDSGEMGPEMRAAFMKLSEETNERMMKVLDEDQQKAYKKLIEARRSMRGRRRSG